MTKPTTVPQTKKKSKQLPPYNLILLNDDKIEVQHVLNHVILILKFNKEDAHEKVMLAHTEGKSILLTTYLEKAELYKEQFDACYPPIPVTIEKI